MKKISKIFGSIFTLIEYAPEAAHVGVVSPSGRGAHGVVQSCDLRGEAPHHVWGEHALQHQRQLRGKLGEEEGLLCWGRRGRRVSWAG